MDVNARKGMVFHPCLGDILIFTKRGKADRIEAPKKGDDACEQQRTFAAGAGPAGKSPVGGMETLYGGIPAALWGRPDSLKE